MVQLQEHLSSFENLHCTLWGICPDQKELIAQWAAEYDIGFPLLSDTSMDAAKAFGIAFRLGDVEVEKYRRWGIDIEATSGETHHLLPMPTAFLVDREGVIRYEYCCPDHTVRPSAATLLTAARERLS